MVRKLGDGVFRQSKPTHARPADATSLLLQSITDAFGGNNAGCAVHPAGSWAAPITQQRHTHHHQQLPSHIHHPVDASMASADTDSSRTLRFQVTG